ncbi:MAG: hypothetical protein JRC59_08650 [Deltaproteobacteria bacterium]|nr:hypothetical protein [Deltaproteobacteria bacterium]
MCTRAVGGLAHFIEEEGVPTTQISLIRPHTEAIKPPRALWVPFDLGRPLGVPNDTEFQKRVLLSVLKLFEESIGPVLKDFPEDAPADKAADVVWASPVNLAPKKIDLSDAGAMRAAFKKEMVELNAWYDLAVKTQQRTTVGVSGLEMDQIVNFIGAFLDSDPANPREDICLAVSLNFAVDDLKAFYYEAAAAQPGRASPTAAELDDWFWGETAAAKVLFAVKDRCLKNDDKMMQLLGKILLIPASHSSI